MSEWETKRQRGGEAREKNTSGRVHLGGKTILKGHRVRKNSDKPKVAARGGGRRIRGENWWEAGGGGLK